VDNVTFRILGWLEALVDGRSVELSSGRERSLLGVLLLHVGEVVSVDGLIDSVWGEAAPSSARHMVHEYVSRLRSAFGEAAVITTRAPGYAVERDTCELDAVRFAELLGGARSAAAADEAEEALEAFDRALGIWRGDALCDVALEGEARLAARRLDDERRAARSERVDVALQVGRHNELIPHLEGAVAAEPLDERVLRQLMLALYRSGRQADALARYRDRRERLVGELGIEPAAESRGLEQAILRHDPELAPPTRRAPASPGAASRPRRRAARSPTTSAATKLRSSSDLLTGLVEKRYPGAVQRGEHLLSAAVARGFDHAPNVLAEWLYELRDQGSIEFDDSDAAATAGNSPRKDLYLVRNIAVTPAGRASVEGAARDHRVERQPQTRSHAPRPST
jgi:DNA-binding SARP family transcriptional activator